MTNARKPMIGLQFNRLRVLDLAGIDERGQRIWLCQCDCGRTSKVNGMALRRGSTKSCGCLRLETASQNLGSWHDRIAADQISAKRGRVLSPLLGQRFGRLEVVGEESSGRTRKCQVRCQCGALKWTRCSTLKAGKVASCGCLRREMARINGAKGGGRPRPSVMGFVVRQALMGGAA